MKNTYELNNWPFYRSSRNEYVETIRMHSIIGNDHSGDNIIYAFYLVYLKDFQKNLTEDKLNLFFPFLDEVFKPLTVLEDTDHSSVYNGVAYVRGLMPKSFARAYNVNSKAVSDIIRQLFSYFDKLHSNNYRNIKIDPDVLNKLQTSFKRNNNYYNDYTKVYVLKNPSKEQAKPVVEYHKKSASVNIPSHFINFKADERKSAEVVFYDRDKVVKKQSLKIEDGAIGWHTSSLSQNLKSRVSQFRYEIRKLSTNEVVYDSGDHHYKSQIDKADRLKNDHKDLTIPEVHECLPNNQKNIVSMSELKTGTVYSIKQTEGLNIKHAHVINDGGDSFFFMRENTEIIFNEKVFRPIKPVRTVSVKNSQTFDDLKIVNGRTEQAIYTGENMAFSVRLRYPYELSNLLVSINSTEIDSKELRSELLTEVLVKEKGDLKFYFNLTEFFNNGINTIEFKININEHTLNISKIDFYYYAQKPFHHEKVEFDNKQFYYIQSDYDLSIEHVSDKDIIGESKSLSSKWELLRKSVDRYKILNSNEVAEGILISTNDLVISDAEKRELIQRSYDTHFLMVEECMLKFYETKGTAVIIEEIKNHKESFVRRVSEYLEKVDTYFIEILTSEIHLVLNGEMPDSFLTERYISPLLESINLEFLDRTSAKYIRRFLNTINPPVDNIEIEIEYRVTDLKSKRKQDIITFINQLSSKRRNVAYYLSSIAANTKLSRMETISALKKVSTNHSNKERKDYLESIDWFREFLYGNPLDLSLIQHETFIDMFLFYTQEIDIPTIAKKLNKIEQSTHSLSDSSSQNEKRYIRIRLNELAKLFEIDIFIV